MVRLDCPAVSGMSDLVTQPPTEYQLRLWRHLVSTAGDRRVLTQSDPLALLSPTSLLSPAATYTCSYMRWPGREHLLATGDEDGTISVWDTTLGQQSVTRYRESHANAIYELDFDASGRELLSCAGDRSIRHWDVQTMQLLSQHTRKARTFKTVSFLPDTSSVFASGGRDGVVEVWDSRVSSGVSHEIHPQSAKKGRAAPDSTALSSVTSLLFRDQNYLLSAGSANASVNVWDLRKTYVGGGAKRAHTPFERFDWLPSDRGVVSMAIDRLNARLYVSRINDVIQRYNLVAWQPERGMCYGGHEARSYFVRCSVSPDGEWLLSGSSDSSARLWHTDVPGNAVCSLPGHDQEVTGSSWCSDGVELATISDDNTLRTWRFGSCQRVSRRADLQPPDTQCLYAVDSHCSSAGDINSDRRAASVLDWLASRQLYWCLSRRRLASSAIASPVCGSGRPAPSTPARTCCSQSPLARAAAGSPGFMRSWLQRVSPAVGQRLDKHPRRSGLRSCAANSASSQIDSLLPTADCSHNTRTPAATDSNDRALESVGGEGLILKRPRSPLSDVCADDSDHAHCSGGAENRENIGGRSPRKRARVECVTPLRSQQPTIPGELSLPVSDADRNTGRVRRSSPRKLFSSNGDSHRSVALRKRNSVFVQSSPDPPSVIVNDCIRSDNSVGGKNNVAADDNVLGKQLSSPKKHSGGAISPLCQKNSESAFHANGMTSSVAGDVATSGTPCTRGTSAAADCSVTSVGRSPTAGLPNWVVDGVSPHSPLSRASRHCRRPRRPADWLTLLSRQKQTQPPRH